MERIYTRVCSPEQCEALMRNVWRYGRVGEAHVRIHPPTSDIPVNPPGPVRYKATIEVLDGEVAPGDTADQEPVDAVAAIFVDALGTSAEAEPAVAPNPAT